MERGKKRTSQQRWDGQGTEEPAYPKGEVSFPEALLEDTPHTTSWVSQPGKPPVQGQKGGARARTSWNHSLEMVLQCNIEVEGITSVPKANSNKRPSPWGTTHDQFQFSEAEKLFS